MSNNDRQIVLKNEDRRLVVVNDPGRGQLELVSSDIVSGNGYHLQHLDNGGSNFGTGDDKIDDGAAVDAGSSNGFRGKICPLCLRPWRPDLASESSNNSFNGESGYQRPRVGHAIVDDSYFDLLSKYLNEEKKHSTRKIEFISINQSGLDQESFNQGYFDRFFEVDRVLGRGGKADVLLVHHALNGISLGDYALKRVAVGDSNVYLKKVLKEVQFMRLRHRNLIHYNHVWLENVQLNRFGPQVPALFILQEYCDGGDLQSFVYNIFNKKDESYNSPELRKQSARERRQSRSFGEKPSSPTSQKDLDPQFVYSVFLDITTGLEFLHSKNIIHRDLKPSNCFLTFTNDSYFPCAVVGDFGEGQLVNETNSAASLSLSLSYSAPELLIGERILPTTKTDIFSLGLILFFLQHRGNLPWHFDEGENFYALKDEIQQWSGLKSDDASKVTSDVLQPTLERDPLLRPSATQVKEAFMALAPEMSGDVEKDSPKIRDIVSPAYSRSWRDEVELTPANSHSTLTELATLDSELSFKNNINLTPRYRASIASVSGRLLPFLRMFARFTRKLNDIFRGKFRNILMTMLVFMQIFAWQRNAMTALPLHISTAILTAVIMLEVEYDSISLAIAVLLTLALMSPISKHVSFISRYIQR